ncbi:MAG: GNAT family N-acetyltransferase [Oscillospiraceae bacterium]|nr:GNAT family N-acetyltransferase [Oscillospiraceae bacterium]
MDLLINLCAVPDPLILPDVTIHRVLPPNFGRVRAFIRETFGDGWAEEAGYAMCHQPVSCYIAVKCSSTGGAKQLAGFACYDATARGYFGPTGVAERFRRQGIGEALLLHTLRGMRENGYGYAIIGWTSDMAVGMYKKIGAVEIPGSGAKNTLYKNLL